MKLYFEAPATVIRAVEKRGFAAAMGDDAAMCCDRSQADVPALPEVTEAFAEVALDVAEDVGGYEVFPMDVPPGRWFRIPAAEMDQLIQKP